MTTQQSAIILVTAPDKEGLVYILSEYIYRHNGNILNAEHHIDESENVFFMRVEWDLTNFTIPRDQIMQSLQPFWDEWGMQIQLYFKDVPVRSAVFVSKADHCLYDLMLKRNSSELPMDLRLIISNHLDCKSVADYFKVPFFHIPITADNKFDQEKYQLELLCQHEIELVILARYMQILSEQMTEAYKHQIINVHHSFLPAFVGAKPYQQAHNKGVKLIGSTAHYATPELDQGPIIEQKVVSVSHKDSQEEFVRKGKELEKQVLSNAVKKYLDRKVLVFKNKTVVFD